MYSVVSFGVNLVLVETTMDERLVSFLVSWVHSITRWK